MKTLNGHINFVTDARITVAFTVIEHNLVMIHDGKIGKHILCKLRKATQDEKQKVGGEYIEKMDSDTLTKLYFFEYS